MNKIEAGRLIFRQIKTHLAQQGQSMNVAKFPADFPVSRRTCYNIALGIWSDDIIEKLPFPVAINYSVEFPSPAHADAP